MVAVSYRIVDGPTLIRVFERDVQLADPGGRPPAGVVGLQFELGVLFASSDSKKFIDQIPCLPVMGCAIVESPDAPQCREQLPWIALLPA